MQQTTVNLLFSLEVCFLVLAAVLGFYAYSRKKSVPLSWITALLATAALDDGIRTFLKPAIAMRQGELEIHSLFIPVLHLMTGMFFLSVCHNKTHRKIIIATLALTELLFLWALIFGDDMVQFPAQRISLKAAMIVLYCLLAISEMIELPASVNIWRHPPFIFTQGFFLFNLIALIVFLFSALLLRDWTDFYVFTGRLLWIAIFVYYGILTSGIAVHILNQRSR